MIERIRFGKGLLPGASGVPADQAYLQSAGGAAPDAGNRPYGAAGMGASRYLGRTGRRGSSPKGPAEGRSVGEGSGKRGPACREAGSPGEGMRPGDFVTRGKGSGLSFSGKRV